MGSPANFAFGPPPLSTPIVSETGDQFGVPYQNRPDTLVPAGSMQIGWASWFSRLFDTVQGILVSLSGIISAIAALPPTGFPGDYTSTTLTGQAGSIAATNVRRGGAVLPAGRYLVTVECGIVPTGAVTLAGVITWQTPTPESIAGTGNFGPGGTSAPITSSTVFIVRTDGATDLKYATTLTGTGVYSLFIDVLRLA